MDDASPVLGIDHGVTLFEFHVLASLLPNPARIRRIVRIPTDGDDAVRGEPIRHFVSGWRAQDSKL